MREDCFLMMRHTLEQVVGVGKTLLYSCRGSGGLDVVSLLAVPPGHVYNLVFPSNSPALVSEARDAQIRTTTISTGNLGTTAHAKRPEPQAKCGILSAVL